MATFIKITLWKASKLLFAYRPNQVPAKQIFVKNFDHYWNWISLWATGLVQKVRTILYFIRTNTHFENSPGVIFFHFGRHDLKITCYRSIWCCYTKFYKDFRIFLKLNINGSYWSCLKVQTILHFIATYTHFESRSHGFSFLQTRFKNYLPLLHLMLLHKILQRF